MSLNSQVVILPRESSNLIAVIKFDSRGEEAEGMKMLIKGITAWMRNTTEGADAWYYSSEDFNVGDLTSYLDHDSNIWKYLNEAGVYNLEIETYGTDSYSLDYNYDTVLADSDELGDKD